MPWAASCSPSHWELVSGIWPSSSSVPTATISTRTGHDSLAPLVVLPSGVDREGDRDPDRHEREDQVMPGEGQHAKANSPVLGERLPLGQSTGRNRDAVSSGAAAKGTHPHFAHRNDDRRNHEEVDAVGPR